MAADITGRVVAFLVAPEGVEQVELTEPWKAVERAGGSPVLVSTQPGRVRGFHHLDRADAFPVDAVVGETGVEAYDALVLPGGVANPDYLRTAADAVRFARSFVEQGKPVAAICHAPWLLVEADVLRGRTVTSFPSLRTDITNAGAEWVDREVVTDRGLVTSRTPKDLEAFNGKLVEEIAEGKHRSQARSA